MNTVELLPPSQAGELVPLFEKVWPEQSNHFADIHWRYQSSPLGAGMLLVTRANEPAILTGARGSIPWPLQQANGELAIIHQVGGTCVHPSFRRLGIFTELTRAFLSQFSANGGTAVFNVSVAAARAGYEKLGWIYLPGLRRYIYIAQPIAFTKALLNSRGRLRSTLQSVYNANQAITSWDDLELLAKTREMALAGTNHTVYNADWVKWRYSREHQGYRFIYRPNIGWCSYRLRRTDNITEVLLGDVLLFEGNNSNVSILMKAVIELEHPTLISIILSRGHPWRPAFLRSGFLPDLKGDLNFGVRLMNGNASLLLDPSRWALMTSDIDTF